MRHALISSLAPWLAGAAWLAAPVCLAEPPRQPATVDPASVGMSAAKLAEITQRMQQAVDSKQTAGVVCLVMRQGKIVHLGAVGQADIENKREMRPDTVFAIASMTKPITAAALMTLWDEGKVGLDDPVSKYIPQFKNAALKSGAAPAREITVRDVLTHTSGLGGEQRNTGTLRETAEALAKRPLDFEPGAKWQYSPGLSVAGRVVEVASGKSFDAFLRERFFEPLGMVDTTFQPTPAQRARLAKLYQPGKEKGVLAPGSHWIVELSDDVTPNPSGGLFSTAADLARFYQLLLNGGEIDGKRILSAKAIAELTRPQTGEHLTGFTPGNAWGLGFCVIQKPQGPTAMLSPGSYGHGGAFGTQGWTDPQRKLVCVLLVQRQGFGNGDASDLRTDLQNLAVEAIEKP